MIFPCACGLARPHRCDIKGKTINMELDGAGPAGSSGHRLFPPSLPPSLPFLRRCVINKQARKAAVGFYGVQTAGDVGLRRPLFLVCFNLSGWEGGTVSENRMKRERESLSLSLAQKWSGKTLKLVFFKLLSNKKARQRSYQQVGEVNRTWNRWALKSCSYQGNKITEKKPARI